jgi:DNA-binding transcriptional MerR regulator
VPEAKSVGEVAAQFGLEPDTLRYYERIGVLPAPTRNSSGHRAYTDQDVHLIEVLLHLRDTGMPLTRIAEFTRLVASDPDAAPERLVLLEEHQAEVLKRLRAWQNSLTLIEQKIDDYRSRLER